MSSEDCFTSDNISCSCAFSFENVGDGEQVYVDGSSDPSQFRTLRGQGDIEVVQNGDEIDINLDIIDVSTGEPILIDPLAPGSASVRGVTGSGLVLASSNATDVDLLLNVQDSDPIPVNGASIIDPSTVAGDLRLRPIQGTGNVQVTAASPVSVNLDIANAVGITGESLISTDSVGLVEFKSVVGANNMAVSTVGSDIQVDLNVSSTGTGDETLISTDTPGSVVLRELVAGSNITLTDVGSDIQISAASAAGLACGANNTIIGPAGPILLATNTMNTVDSTAGVVSLVFPVGVDSNVIEIKDLTGIGSGVGSVTIVTSGGQLIEDPSLPNAATPFGTSASFCGIPKEGYKWEFCGNVNGGTWVATLDYDPKPGVSGNPLSNCYTYVVENGRTVNKDAGISILSGGTAVQGYGDPGTTNIIGVSSTDYSTMLDPAANRYVILDQTGIVRIVTNNAANTRPTFGPEFTATLLGEVEAIVSLDTTHFAIVSSDGSTTVGTRVYQTNGVDTITTEGALVTETFGGSDRATGVSLANGAEFVLVIIDSNSVVSLRHYSIAGTTLTATAALQPTVYTGVTTLMRPIANPFENTTTTFVLGLFRDQFTDIVAVSWDGVSTFTAGTGINPTWTPVLSSVGTTDLIRISGTLFAIASSSSRYSTYSIAGTAITAETVNAAIIVSPILNRGTWLGAVDNMNIIAYTSENQAVHGTIAGLSPFAITWGTPITASGQNSNPLNSSTTRGCVVYTSATEASICGNGFITSLLVNQGANSVSLYEFEGEAPIGLAKSTVVGDGVLTVEVTSFGSHSTTAALIVGRLYLINGDGTVTLLSVGDTILQTGDTRAVGVAVATNELFITWPST